MVDLYDFSQHTKCITIGFNEYELFHYSFLSSNTRKWETLEWLEKNKICQKPFASYIPENSSPDSFYVKNVFMELNNIYLKRKQGTSDLHYDAFIFESVEKILQEIVNPNDAAGNKKHYISNSYYHYSFIIPTYFDYAIREELLRPLFIRAGLITENDQKGRLLFFTKLESIFSSMQSPQYNQLYKKSILNGKHFIMYGLNFSENILSVDLDLFSAQYPPSTSVDTNYIPKALKSISFNIPINLDFYYYTEDLELYYDTEDLELYYDTEDVKFAMKSLEILNSDDRRLYPQERAFFKGIYTYNDSYIYSLKKYLYMINIIRRDFSYQLDTLMGDNNLPKTGNIFMGLLKYMKQRYSGYEELFLRDLIEWLQNIFEKYRGNRFNYKQLIEPGSVSFDTAILGSHYLNGGSIFLTRQCMLISSVFRSPKIISQNKALEFELSQLPMFVDSKPNYAINIDMTFSNINIISTYLRGDGCVKNSVKFSTFGLQPLKNFFVQSSQSQQPTLLITNRMKIFMDENFKDFINFYPEYNGKKIKSIYPHVAEKIEGFLGVISINKRVKSHIIMDILKETGSRVKKCLAKNEMQVIFSETNDERIVQIKQSTYVYIFLIIYLGYLDQLITKQLDKLMSSKMQRKVGYLITVEKILLDTIFGSKEDMHKLLLGSGMIKKKSEYKKAQVFIRGENILPVIQKKTTLNLSLKSYFVVAQLNSNYIEITLHQVVKTSLFKENASSIIIQDKIIQIENMNAAICKNIFSLTKLNAILQACSFHRDEDILSKVKECLPDILSSIYDLFNMDNISNILISNACNCSIPISVRYIIDNGLKPVVQDIANTIAASLTNTDLFGHYNLNYMFVIGNLFNFPKDRLIFEVYCNILQEELVSSIKSKEKDLNLVIFREDLSQLLQESINMYDSFVTGNLHQVSSETYVIYHECDDINTKKKIKKPVEICGCVRMKSVQGKSAARVILRKGDLLPASGLIKTLELDINNCKEYGLTNTRLEIKIARVRHLDNDIINDSVSLYQYYYNDVDTFSVIMRKTWDPNFLILLHLKIMYIYNEYSLQFSIDMIHEKYSECPRNTITATVREDLAISYI